ncbi:TPM domain-containing protein [Blastococcus sp. SYSU D01042]
MRAVAARALATLAAPVLLLLTPGVASAAPPADVGDRLTDAVGALAPSTSAVDDALAELAADTGVDLHVVVVEEFAPTGDVDWAEATARRSELGPTDALLAVAIEQETYEYSWWLGDNFPLSYEDMGEIITAEVEPAMNAGRWAAGVTGVTEELRRTLTAAGLEAEMFEAPTWDGELTRIVVGGAAAVLLVGHLLSRRGSPAAPDA